MKHKDEFLESLVEHRNNLGRFYLKVEDINGRITYDPLGLLCILFVRKTGINRWHRVTRYEPTDLGYLHGFDHHICYPPSYVYDYFGLTKDSFLYTYTKDPTRPATIDALRSWDRSVIRFDVFLKTLEVIL